MVCKILFYNFGDNLPFCCKVLPSLNRDKRFVYGYNSMDKTSLAMVCGRPADWANGAGAIAGGQ
jgi:hypothetical protein